MQVHEKVGKSQFTVFLPMVCGSGGSKSRLDKAAGAEPSGQMRDERRLAHLQGVMVPVEPSSLRSDLVEPPKDDPEMLQQGY